MRLNGPDLPEGVILDVGCGYGPIGLSLAHASGRQVEMIDINQRALSILPEGMRNAMASKMSIFMPRISAKAKPIHLCEAILSNHADPSGQRCRT